MNYGLHALCTLFPVISGDEFDALVSDIKQNGLRNPITVYQNTILDGGNRYRACIAAGVEPRYEEFTGEDIVSFVLSANLHRRHLSAGQQATIVSLAQDWTKAYTQGGTGNNQYSGKEQTCSTAPLHMVEDRAAESGASVRTQKMADKVARENPELAQQVAHGEISLPAAIEVITGKNPNKKQSGANTQQDTESKQKIEDLEAYILELEQAILEKDDTIITLADENQRLRDALAINQLPSDEVQSAAELIADLRAEQKSQAIALSAVTSSRDSYLRENEQLKTQCAIQRKQLKKIGAAS